MDYVILLSASKTVWNPIRMVWLYHSVVSAVRHSKFELCTSLCQERFAYKSKVALGSAETPSNV